MNCIDNVIATIHGLTDQQRTALRTNAERVIARGAQHNPKHAQAVRVLNALNALQSARPAEYSLIAACGLDWDRVTAGRTLFRGFAGPQLVTLITRRSAACFTVRVKGTLLNRTFRQLSQAREAAAEALSADNKDVIPIARAA